MGWETQVGQIKKNNSRLCVLTFTVKDGKLGDLDSVANHADGSPRVGRFLNLMLSGFSEESEKTSRVENHRVACHFSRSRLRMGPVTFAMGILF